MTEWMMWLIMAGVLIILEMFTGTFYLLMIAIGLGAGGLTAFAGGSNSMQLIMAAVVGVIATYILRRSKFGKSGKMDAAHDPNINLDIGQQVTVKEWDQQQGGQATARVMYRDAMWDVELIPGNIPEPGIFVIREIRGSRLIVTSSKSNH